MAVLRKALKALGWLALVLLAVGLAWVASNGPWADAAPQPTDARLQLEPSQAPARDNGFVALQALDAPPGTDLAAAGQAALDGRPPEGAARLRWPSAALWNCQPRQEDCAARWLAQPADVSAYLAATAELGARCREVARAPAFEEVAIHRHAEGPLADVSFVALPWPRFGDLTNCVRWFGLHAVAARDPRDAAAALVEADQFARRALQGARSTVGVMIGVATVQRNWLLAADLVAHQRLDASGLNRLLAPLPAEALSPRRWIPSEARFGREVTRDLVDDRHNCRSGEAEADTAPRGWADRLVCHLGLGFLLEQTLQDSDQRWLARLDALPATGAPACEALDTPAWRAPTAAGLAWRNTVARWVLDVPGVDWSPYAARQLDLELLRQTLHSLLQGQSPPAVVSLTRETTGQRFAACRARLATDDAEATLRLPLL